MSDEIVDTAPVAPEAAAAPVATPEPTVDDTMREVLADIRAREPSRADDGKFQPKVVAQGAPTGIEVPGKPQAAPPDPAAPVIEPPQSLPADVKAKWSALPPETQQWLANRESEVHKKFTTDGERLKVLEQYQEALKDQQDYLRQNNIPEAEFIRRMGVANRMFLTNPQAALQWLDQTYNLGLAQRLNPGGQPDPSNALTTKISELESRLAEREEADKQARLNDATQRIEQFKKDRPYFDEATDMMDKLIRSGAAKGLEDAYDMAINAHPEIRAALATDAKKAAEKKAADEAAERQAKDAKIAPFARRPGSAPAVASKKGSWEDTMKEVQAEIRARN